MPDFARVGEKAILRRKELTRAEWDFYIIVLLHSYPNDAGLRTCRLSVKELCKIHDLDYDNTIRRFARMRTGKFSPKEKPPKNVQPMGSPWLKQSWLDGKKVIVPLVGMINVENKDFEQKKQRSEIRTETVKNTVQQTNGHKSQFTLDECFKYAKMQPGITNPQGLALTMFRTGESDAFILAALFPERMKEVESERFGEPRKFTDESCSVCFGAKMADPDNKGYRKCAHCRDEKGQPTGFEPLDSFNDLRRKNALEMLQEYLADGMSLEDFENLYSKEDWVWLMKNLGTAKAAIP